MGLVHAYKKGEVPASQVSQAVKDAAKSMKKKSTKKMASTKHKGLPNKVRSENMNEDGHTDVASAERKLKLIMKDAMDTLNALRSLSNEDSLPSWWTDKITLAKDYVGKSRDYIMNPAESVNEDITSAGYFFLRKAAYGIGIALRDLNSGIKRQNDKIVLNEIDYIYDKVIDMKRMLKNKKYNESINEKTVSIGGEDLMKYLMKRFKMSKSQAIASMKKHKMDMSFLKKESVNENYYVLSQKKGTTNKPEAEVFKSKILALRYAKSLEKTHVIMFLDKQSNMKNIQVKSESVNETPQKVAKLLIKYGNNPKDVKDMVKKHYKKAKKDRSKSTPSELANYISFLSANESVNEGKGVEKILKMASEKSFGKIAGRTVDGMTAGLFKAVYDKAPQNSKDKIDKMNEKQLYVFMGKLWNKFGRQVKLS